MVKSQLQENTWKERMICLCLQPWQECSRFAFLLVASDCLQGGGFVGQSSLFSTQTWRLRLNQGGRFGWLMISRFAHYFHSWLWRSRWHNISGWKRDHDLIRHFGETSPVWKLQTPQMACFHFAQTKATTLLTPDWMMHAVVECATKELVAVNLSGDCTVGLLERHLWGVTNDHRGASWKLVVII